GHRLRSVRPRHPASPRTAARRRHGAQLSQTPVTSATRTLALRVAEARVEDIAHAVARLTASDLERIGASAGDILRITGRTVAVARAAAADGGEDGTIQIDGT